MSPNWGGDSWPWGRSRQARNRVQAYERITVPAGTFDTLRLHSVLTPAKSLTCWWSVEQQVDVKCVTRTICARDPGNPYDWGAEPAACTITQVAIEVRR